MKTPHTALLAAVVDFLRADETVAALVGARVFDDVPADKERPNPPYVYVGPIARTRIELGGDPAGTMRMRLFAVSDEFGRLQAWEVINACGDALEGQELALAAPFVMADIIRIAQDGDVISPANPKATFLDLVTIVHTAS